MKPPKVGAKNEKQMQPPPPPPIEKHPPKKKQNLKDKLAAQQQDTNVLAFFLKLSEKKALHNCHKADKVIGLWRCSFIVDLYCKF